MNELEKLITSGTPIKPSDFPPQHNGERFRVRELGNEWQVYGIGVVNVCTCTSKSMAEMIQKSLELMPKVTVTVGDDGFDAYYVHLDGE